MRALVILGLLASMGLATLFVVGVPAPDAVSPASNDVAWAEARPDRSRDRARVRPGAPTRNWPWAWRSSVR